MDQSCHDDALKLQSIMSVYLFVGKFKHRSNSHAISHDDDCCEYHWYLSIADGTVHSDIAKLSRNTQTKLTLVLAYENCDISDQQSYLQADTVPK